MLNKTEILKVLRNQGALTVDMAEAFVRGEPEILYANENAIYLTHNCKANMLWADSMESAHDALKDFKQSARVCVVHGKNAYQVYTEKYGISNDDGFCDQYCLSKKEKLEVPNVCQMRLMTYSDIPFIQKHYELSNDTDYLKWRIDEGELHGAVVEGELAGFIGSHSDGSIGMLEVIPKFRRRGIATALENYQMNRHMDKGWTPYGQVYIDNMESHALQSKVGLEISKDIICWVHNKDMD